jgi:hypothetical protein
MSNQNTIRLSYVKQAPISDVKETAMTRQHSRKAVGTRSFRSALKAGAGTALGRIAIAFRIGLGSLWRFGVRPPSVPPGPRQFPGLASVDLESIVRADAADAKEPELFPLPDPSTPRGKPAAAPARRSSGSRLYVGH